MVQKMSRLNVEFTADAWNEYCQWQKTDHKVVKRIDQLILDTLRQPFSGKGKPEPLRGNLKGYWSRRITHEHRLVYAVLEDRIAIVQVKYHC